MMAFRFFSWKFSIIYIIFYLFYFKLMKNIKNNFYLVFWFIHIGEELVYTVYGWKCFAVWVGRIATWCQQGTCSRDMLAWVRRARGSGPRRDLWWAASLTPAPVCCPSPSMGRRWPTNTKWNLELDSSPQSSANPPAKKCCSLNLDTPR